MVLQDLEGHLNAGKKYWSELFPEAIADGRVEFEPHDFFTENPRKAPNTIYWFRFVTRESLHSFVRHMCMIRFLQMTGMTSGRTLLP